MQLIAEVKSMSPFGFKSSRTYADLFEFAIRYGDIISIHTDPRWGGSWQNLQDARDATAMPILAKGMHTPYEVDMALDRGADFVLTVGYVHPDPRAWFEPIDLSQLLTLWNRDMGKRVVWNNRNIFTGLPKSVQYQPEIIDFVGEQWICMASMYSSPEKVPKGVAAVLVGQNLPAYIDAKVKMEKEE